MSDTTDTAQSTQAGQRDARRPLAFRPADPLGFVTPLELEQLAAAMRGLGLDSAKMTADGRFLLLGLDPAMAPTVQGCLGPLAAHRPCQVHACPGAAGCPNGLRDTLDFARRLDELISGLTLPAKLKAGISGCPRCCAESMVRDVGLIGARNGWTVTFGGNAGFTPRTADILAKGLSDEEALDLLARVLHHYSATTLKNERTARFAQRLGSDALRRAFGLGTQE